MVYIRVSRCRSFTGARIETLGTTISISLDASRSFAGAWIETVLKFVRQASNFCRSFTGALVKNYFEDREAALLRSIPFQETVRRIKFIRRKI